MPEHPKGEADSSEARLELFAAMIRARWASLEDWGTVKDCALRTSCWRRRLTTLCNWCMAEAGPGGGHWAGSAAADACCCSLEGGGQGS